ncbi:MAG: C-GCAxxG-C-C family protein [Desulfovibrio sp.]|nr:C-GCAxxG-C-C family protein [Desulfovibrio sp.]
MVTKISLKKIKEQAEKHYSDGDFFCSEAIVSTIRTHFEADIPLSAIAMASGFPVGVGGSKCICGAVSGGVMCLGFFFGRTNPKDERVNKAMALAHELYDSFKSNHKVLCCRVLTKNMELGTPDHMRQCISFTGEVAEKTAQIIARELEIQIR